MITEWEAFKAAQAKSDAAYAAYRAAADEAAQALEAYSRAVCQGVGATLALPSDRPLNTGDERVLVGVQQW